ncbi:unnamed protein product, partial [marine sediment metagenome]
MSIIVPTTSSIHGSQMPITIAVDVGEDDYIYGLGINLELA